MDPGFQTWNPGFPSVPQHVAPTWGCPTAYTGQSLPLQQNQMFYPSAQASSMYTGHQQYYSPVHYNNNMLTNAYPAYQGHFNVANINNNDGRMNPPSADGQGSLPTIPVSHESDSDVVHPPEEDDAQNCSIDLDPDMGDVSDPDSALNKGKLNEYKEAHMVLGDLFPERFHTKVQNLPYYMVPQGPDSQAFFKNPSNPPLLKINPDKQGTWWEARDKENPSDTTSYWKASTKFPSKTRVNPVHYPFKVPPKNPYVHVEDEDLKQLLEAPAFTTVPLDHSAFDSPSVDLARNPHTHLDTLLRSSLLASYTIDEYLKILLELIPKCALSSTPKEDRLRFLDLTMDVVLMVAENNHRSGQTQLASYVSNKLALRDVVLNRFHSQNTSLNILRGSSFLSPNLFGPLPESFKESLKLDHNKSLRLTRKAFTFNRRTASTTASGWRTTSRSFSKPMKRPANFLPSNPNKRFKGSWNRGRKSFSKQQFFRFKGQKRN